MSSSGQGTQAGRGRTAAVIGLFVLVVLVALVVVGSPSATERLDPRSHEDQGTSALMALLGELRAEVTLDVRVGDEAVGADEFDVIVVLRDVMDEEDRRLLRRWVTDGGTLVVADPRSPLVPLHGESSADNGDDSATEPDPDTPTDRRYADLDNFSEPTSVPRDTCTIEALAGLDAGVLQVEGRTYSYPVAPEYESCYGSEREAFVVAKPRGEGTEVSLGGAGVLTNEALDNQTSRDNAVVLAALMAPDDGTRVAVLDASPSLAPGEETLWDLVPRWVKLAGAQLIVAFIVFALWRARRLGRPVAEPQPVKVASSELVAAVGGLLQRTASPQHAADMLRADLRRDLVSRLALAPDLLPEAFFQVVESRVSPEGAQLLHLALGPGPVSTDQDLLTVMQAIDAVRKEVFDSVGTGS